MVSELCPLLESGGFHLTKFLSNEPGVLSSVPEDDQASAMLDLNLDDLATTKARCLLEHEQRLLRGQSKYSEETPHQKRFAFSGKSDLQCAWSGATLHSTSS